MMVGMDPTPEQLTIIDNRIAYDGDHWVWPGPFTDDRPTYGRHRWSVRRLMWIEHVGPIPRTKQTTGMCGRPDCVNPMHSALTDKNAATGNLHPKTPLIERLLRRTEVCDDCWVYPTPRIRDEEGVEHPTRQVAAAWWRPDLAGTSRLKMTCRNTLCFNPDHLTDENYTSEPAGEPEYPSTPLTCFFDHLVIGDNLVRTRKPHRAFERVCRTCRDEYDQHVMDMEILVDPREKLRAKFLQQRAMAKA